MSDQVKCNLQVNPKVSLDVNLDAHDIVDIHVAMREDSLLRAEKELQSKLEEARKDLEEKGRKLQAALLVLGKAKAKEAEDKLAKCLKQAGFAGLKFSCSAATQANTIQYNLEVSSKMGRLNSQRLGRVPKHVAELRDARVRADGLVEQIKNYILKTKQDLSNVSRMERKARAQMAIRALESTPEGRAMLNNIKSDAVKLLPAPE